jgi:hypothetical protein
MWNIARIWENEVAMLLPTLLGYFLACRFSNSPWSVFPGNEVISDETFQLVLVSARIEMEVGQK